MKKLFATVIFISLSIPTFADQTVVVELPGKKKSDIYQQSLQWITYKFNSGKAVVDYQSPDVGRIIGKGNVYMGDFVFNGIFVYEIITIDCLNNKARIQMTSNNKCRSEGNRGGRDCPCETFYIGSYADKIDETESRLIDEYKEYMKNGGGAAWDGK